MNGFHRSKDSPECSGSNERLGMTTLNGHHGQDASEDDDDDDDDDSTGDDEGDRALLDSGRRSGYSQEKTSSEESTWRFVRGILVETAPTLLLTTVGLTFTGELLDKVSCWRALQQIDELYILIPMLNNLKGNLEMNLSSRLATAANTGSLDVLSMRRALLLGNLSIVQAQALLISALAASVSFLLGLIISPASPQPRLQTGTSPRRRRLPFPKPPPNPDKSRSGVREFGMILSTGMASASISGLILGSFMCSLILICRRFRLNPDNIAPPVASCLGDLLTLCILGLTSAVLIRTIDTVLPVLVIIILAIGAVAAIMLTLRNEYVRQLIFSGWTPLLGAMLISSGTGLVLDHFVNRYEGFGLFAVVISGLSEAVGSVFISRLATSLHASASNPFYPDGKPTHDPRMFVTAVTLFLVTLPVQLLFLTFVYAVGWTRLPFVFVAIFVLFFCCTVLISLAMARLLTYFLWRRGLDPDTYAMPIQSSLTDLTGQLMLVACYELVQALGADVKNKPTQ